MNSLTEIEEAADRLSLVDQGMLLRHLSGKLARRAKGAPFLVAPPSVPQEELRRIHALIEKEFSCVDAEGW